jgi:Fic family protein
MNRQKYYELLDRVRTHGDWETWLEFFLTGVKETAQQAADTSREILTLIVKRTAGKLRSLAALLDRFCGFTNTFNASGSSQSPQQPNNSLFLRLLWRRLCNTW